MNLLDRLLSFAGYFCVATVLVQGIAITLLLSRGSLSQRHLKEMIAVVYQVDRLSVRELIEKGENNQTGETIDFAGMSQKRSLLGLNLDLRETAIEKAVGDLRYLETTLGDERFRYDQLRNSFEDQLARQQDVNSEKNLTELRQTIEAIDARLAKEQIKQFLKSKEQTNDESIENDIVAVIKAMPIDKRKKIIAEFKTPEEQDLLRDIFRKIRQGVPDVPLIRKTQQELKRFDPKTTRG